MHYIAKQTPPEWQESPLFTMEDFPENIAVFGNRNMNEHIPPIVGHVKTVLESGELANEIDLLSHPERNYSADYGPNYDSINNAIDAFLFYWDTERTYVEGDYQKVISALQLKEPWSLDGICLCLDALTGERWLNACISGDCQGDWQNVVWPDNKWSADALHNFQVEYFNTGYEWQIFGYTDDDQTPDDFGTVYTHGWSNGDAIKEIAAVLAADPDEITLQHFTGWKQIPEWEEV